MYIENPKTKDSGIMCVIPHSEPCRVGCEECFFSHGRSYLEPLSKNLPNLPEVKPGYVYRINDGNDSSIDIEKVLSTSQKYEMRFYNTCFSYNMKAFDAPVVLTVNGGMKTDIEFEKCDSKKLMFVRFRVNTWNFTLAKECIMWYVERDVPVVLTWMAYHAKDKIPFEHQKKYERRKRTLNEYWCVKLEEWKKLMRWVSESPYGKLVRSCSGPGDTGCRNCGNCLTFYFRKASCWEQQA